MNMNDIALLTITHVEISRLNKRIKKRRLKSGHYLSADGLEETTELLDSLEGYITQYTAALVKETFREQLKIKTKRKTHATNH